ncbi:MAG: hypothetical protein P4M14_04505 [Gammaproteobacteria bacterium]|nr:hypothetical protein [Gammaproteobacteria bacterium]
MFGFFSKKMTEHSHHYLDWSRVGELLRVGNHRYSQDEIIMRGGIIACTALSAFLAGYFNNPEKTNCSTSTLSIIGGVFGFTLSHAIVIYPLIKKRREMSTDCHNTVNAIHKMDMPHQEKIQAVITHILNLSLSNDKHSNASQTWGRRKYLLNKLHEQLKDQQTPLDFNYDSIEEIVAKLNADRNTQALARKLS